MPWDACPYSPPASIVPMLAPAFTNSLRAAAQALHCIASPLVLQAIALALHLDIDEKLVESCITALTKMLTTKEPNVK